MKLINSLLFSFLFILFTTYSIHAAEVLPDGSLSHTIEIKLPGSSVKLAPQLFISYNSNAGNGIAGVGFALGGLSAIERDPVSWIWKKIGLSTKIAAGLAAFGIAIDAIAMGSKGQLAKLGFGYDFKNAKKMYPHVQNLWK